jgi:hypothetical protein
MSPERNEKRIRLDKTTAEQEIVRSIEALESSLRAAEDSESKKSLMEQIKVLKDQLLMLGGPNYSELCYENDLLKAEVKELKKRLAGGEGGAGSIKAKEAGEEDEHSRGLRNHLYRLLIRKYAQLINDYERKTVGELKSLVNADDLTVQSLANQFMAEGYEYSRDYPKAAEALFDSLKGIEYVSSGPDIKLNFWLTPQEILSEKIADDEDFAVFLCSLLFALGDTKAEVAIAELDNLETHAFVITESGGRFILLDPCQNTGFYSFAGKREEVLSGYSFRGSGIRRFIYKFSHSSYEQFVD